MKRPTLTRCCSNTTAYTRDSSLREIGFERSWNEATYRRNLPGGLRDDCGCFHVVETRESACGHLRNRARQSLGHTRHRVAATARHALGAVLSSPEYRGDCLWSGPYLVRTEVADRHHSTATGKRVAEFAVGIVAKDRTGAPTFRTLDAEVPRAGIGLDLRQRQRLIERRNGSAYFGGQLHLTLKSSRVYYPRLVAAHFNSLRPRRSTRSQVIKPSMPQRHRAAGGRLQEQHACEGGSATEYHLAGSGVATIRATRFRFAPPNFRCTRPPRRWHPPAVQTAIARSRRCRFRE